LESGDSPTKIGHRLVEGSAGLPLPSALPPDDARREVQFGELVPLSDAGKNPASLLQPFVRRLPLAGLGKGEAQEAEGAGLFDSVADPPRDRERAFPAPK